MCRGRVKNSRKNDWSFGFISTIKFKKQSEKIKRDKTNKMLKHL